MPVTSLGDFGSRSMLPISSIISDRQWGGKGVIFFSLEKLEVLCIILSEACFKISNIP
jgi:hypothetical protein